jgi:hypothetical protein
VLQAQVSEARATASGDSEDATCGAYRAPAEHVVDLLRRVDLLLQREILRYRASRPGIRTSPENDWLRFAAITDEEIDDLLAPTAPEEADRDVMLELQRIEHRLVRLAARQAQRLAASAEAGVCVPAVELARRFGLTSQEVDAVALCLAPEIDRRYERIYGYLHDDMTRRRPSVGLILEVCAPDQPSRMALRSLFAWDAALVSHRMVHINDESAPEPLASRPVRLDERIVGFLLGHSRIDSQLRDAATVSLPDPRASYLTAGQETAVRKIIEACSDRQSAGRRAPVFYLFSSTPGAIAAVAREVCRRLHALQLDVDAPQLAKGSGGFEDGVVLAMRESVLMQAVLVLDHLDKALDNDAGAQRAAELGRNLETYGGLVLLAGEKPWSWPVRAGGRVPVPIALRRPDYTEQVDLWRAALGPDSELADPQLHRLASVYPLAPAKLVEVVDLARELSDVNGHRQLHVPELERCCRAQSRADFGPLARKVEPKFGWEDLILPPRQFEQLREICAQATCRSIVYGQWGFDRKLSLGRGLNVLFAGASGTGKTMAAEVIANDLGLDLFKIDLSQVVSKYIGETEKNLHQIFRVADAAQAILLFDEADALLGRRSEVRDAHDRYANIEVAYLLQKMEEYEGITVLATNLRQNIDEAFTRRIRFIVEFPYPEEDDRLRIWRGIWPPQTPLAADVDLAYLARQFRMTGGSIRNAALAAAFRASEDGQAVSMAHLLAATHRELQKMGRLIMEEDHARVG